MYFKVTQFILTSNNERIQVETHKSYDLKETVKSCITKVRNTSIIIGVKNDTGSIVPTPFHFTPFEGKILMFVHGYNEDECRVETFELVTTSDFPFPSITYDPC